MNLCWVWWARAVQCTVLPRVPLLGPHATKRIYSCRVHVGWRSFVLNVVWCLLWKLAARGCPEVIWRRREWWVLSFLQLLSGIVHLVLLWLLTVEWDWCPVLTLIRKEILVVRLTNRSLMTLTLLWGFDGNVRLFLCPVGDMKLYGVCKILEFEKVGRLFDFQIGFHDRSLCTMVLRRVKTKI